ncbi:MAG: TldD/PmbA family protein [Euryarchaeota archaeon]|jgi:PmbA protein|nr:TldD/PmbA family protein [Euryarchaeota archaeon]MBT4982156.1 TldD/PmbA family protein [Euryarchaeota archaeon]
MNMIPDDAVERLLESAHAIGKACEQAGVQQWEVFATQEYGHSLEIEAGRISMASGGGEGGFGIRVVEDGRYGYAHLVDPNTAARAIRQAIGIAKLSPSIDGFELPSNQDASKVGGMKDKSILDMGPEDLLEQGDDILTKVAELDSRAVAVGGGVGVSAGAGAIVTSSGIEDGGIHTAHGVGVHVSIDEDEHLTSSYEGESSRFLLKDLTASVEKAVHWSQITRNKIPGGETQDCPVLMTSDGFSPLFSVVVPAAIKGERLARGESFWSGKMDQMVMANHLSLIDDGLMEGGMSSGSRDGEGVPSRTQTLVDSGRLSGEIWATRDAAKLVAEGKVSSAKSTGSAARGGHTSPPLCGCSDLILSSSDKTLSRDRLIEEMETGYIVHSVMGAHTANPTSGDFSVTTSTILRVEAGEIIGSLSQAGLSGNLAKALAGRVVLGESAKRKGSYSTGSMHVTDVLLMDGLRINPA